ncbi:MAG TPA: PepSY domain-containing protein, partial [Chryseosolibacter sp.]|nr:PepSY domain-containing protein [Chryseosolibacter sp.]
MRKLLSKDVLFKIHGWVGMKLSILFFIVCFSGTLAVFSHEMDWLINPAMRATPQETFGSRNANRVYINPHTSKVIYVQRADQINTITWLNDIADPLHFGHWGGLVTKTVWFTFG